MRGPACCAAHEQPVHVPRLCPASQLTRAPCCTPCARSKCTVRTLALCALAAASAHASLTHLTFSCCPGLGLDDVVPLALAARPPAGKTLHISLMPGSDEQPEPFTPEQEEALQARLAAWRAGMGPEVGQVQLSLSYE